MNNKILWQAKGTIKEITGDSFIAQMIDSDENWIVAEFEFLKTKNIIDDQLFLGNSIYFYIYPDGTSNVFADVPYYFSVEDIVKAEILADKIYGKLKTGETK